MKVKIMKKIFLESFMLFLIITMVLSALSLNGCDGNNVKVKLDPENPVTISVWHYYNGAILNAFDAMTKNFNETVGMREGIIVEGYGMGNVSELEKAVMASANKEVGSMAMPNIFASYADTAYVAEKLGILANLDYYFTKKEQSEYMESYIEEGKIGLNGELKIFPIAKSTELLMLNETDWLPFAEANNLTYGDLATLEGITRVAEIYYNWTDAATPDIQNDGKAFYGRDYMANFFIISSKEFDTEIFQVKNGEVTINVDEGVMRKIWDNYYVPYISGYFASYGRFRSDDTKVGDILAYVGSTSSASYFPSEVTVNGNTYPIAPRVLPAPHFENGKKAMVQQGAGMVVTKATQQEEYASILFLKWFTEQQNNIEFSALTGYMPVKNTANDYDTFMSELESKNKTLDDITKATLTTAFNEIKTSELYTNKSFDGGIEARAVIEHNLQDKVIAERQAVVQAIANGSSHSDAVAQFNTEENFRGWLQDITSKLNETVK